MYKDAIPYLSLLGLCLAFTGNAAGQCFISDGSVGFEIEDFAQPWSPDAHLLDLEIDTGSDHLYKWGYYYRIAGDEGETEFPAPDEIACVQTEASGTLTWNDLDGRGLLSALSTLTVADVGQASTFTAEVTLTNLTANTVDVALFNYADPDVGQNAFGNTASELGPNLIEVRDSTSGVVVQYASPGAAGYAVLSFSDPAIELGLGDEGVTDFMNTGLPFPRWDMNAGFQHNLSLAAGESATAVFALGINTDAPVSVGISTPDGWTPEDVKLNWSAHPNPFTTRTRVEYQIDEPTQVRLEVYDTLGRHVHTLADDWHRAGLHRTAWTPRTDLAAGVYLLRLEAGPRLVTRTLVLQ